MLYKQAWQELKDYLKESRLLPLEQLRCQNILAKMKELEKRWKIIPEKAKEDCPVCHGTGATTDHHDPCTECGGSGRIGG